MKAYSWHGFNTCNLISKGKNSYEVEGGGVKKFPVESKNRGKNTSF